MATSRKDVELVIKARNEASKAIDTVAGALKFLATAQENVAAGGAEVGSSMAALKGAITAVQTAYGRIDKEADAAAAAFERQKARLAETQAEFAAVTAQIDAAKEALSRLRSQKGADFIGPVNVPALKAAEAAYRELQSQASRLASNIGRQETAIEGARSALQQLGSTAIAAEQALDGVGTPEQRAAVLAHAEAFARAERQAEQYRKEIARLAADEAARRNDQFFGISGRPVNSARESAAVFEEAARTEEQMAGAAAELRARLDPLATIQARLNGEVAKARDLYRAGRITATELAKAEKLLATEADRAARAMAKGGARRGGFLGLQPHELTSLSYQVNDVFTQLASGTSLTQTLAQQGGQFFQIFQRQLGAALPSLAKFVPLIGAAVTAVLTMRAAMRRITDEQASRRAFAAVLAASADGADHQATALATAAHQVDLYGASLKDAREAVQEFLKAGVRDDQLERFGRAALDMARVFKVQLPEAVKQTAAAFTGGYEAVKRLDDSLNFLTAAERDHIKAMFDSGNAAGARTEAFRIYQRQMNEAAEKALGPWSKAFRDLGSAWHSFVNFLSDTPLIRGAVKTMQDLATAAERVAAALPGAQGRTGDPLSAELKAAQTELALMEGQKARARQRMIEITWRTAGRAPNADQEAAFTLQLKPLTAKIEAARAKVAALTKQIADAGAAADTINPDDQARLKARAEELDRIERERVGTIGDVTDARKVSLAGERAYQDAIRETGDIAVAAARKQLAIDQEVERQRKALNFSRVASKIIGAESSGDPTAKNGASTATGLGQFVEKTWLELFRKHFPTQAADMTEKQILALRRDGERSKQLVELYARENADVLQKAGKAVTEANLYLAHFLGPQGAVKVLSAKATASVSKLLSPDAIAANPTILKGKTAGQVISFAQAKVGRSDEERARQDSRAAVQEQLTADAREFNKVLDDQNAARREEAAALAALADQEKLTIEQKYAAQKAAEIAVALHKAEALALEHNQVLSAARRQEISETVGALFELQHAEAKANEILRQKREVISDTIGLEQQRKALLQQLQFALSQGDRDAVVSLRDQIEAIRLKLVEAVPQALALAHALGDERAVAALQGVVLTIQTLREQILSARQANDMLAYGLVSSFDQAVQAIGEGKNAIESMANSFRAFAADFLRQMAMMILRTQLLKLLSSAFGGANGGVGGAIAGAVNKLAAGSNHRGGLAGSGPKRFVPAAAWANMVRYHNGGIAGLKPNEVPTILERGEEILTKGDARHRANGGLSPAAPPQAVKIVNLFDAADVVSAALNTTDGERAVLNVVKRNGAAVRNAIGVAG
jgi:hypothetical protein